MHTIVYITNNLVFTWPRRSFFVFHRLCQIDTNRSSKQFGLILNNYTGFVTLSYGKWRIKLRLTNSFLSITETKINCMLENVVHKKELCFTNSNSMTMIIFNNRGVRLAKHDFSSFLQKNCGFQFGFGSTKLTAVSVFMVRFFALCVV